MEPVTSRAQLSNLQIARGVAAAMVVVAHALHEAGAFEGPEEGGPRTLLNLGFGVDIFFVISGFIMMHVAHGEFGLPGAPWRFFARRLARIAPLYWLLTALMIGGALIAPGLLNVPLGGVRHVVLSLLFIPDWRPDMSIVRPVLALGWTLNYEMLFYLCFAGALMLPRRLGVAALTFGFLAMTLLGAWLRVTQTQIAFWTDPIVLEFVLGVFIALIHRGPWRASAGLAVALAGAGLVLGVGQPMAWLGFDNLPRSLEFGLPAVLIVAGAALGPTLRAGRITWALIALGDASYALYLCHPFAVRLLRVAWRNSVGAVAPVAVYVVVCLAASIACAILIHRLIERPVTAFLQSRLTRRKLSRWRPFAPGEPGPRRVEL